MHPSENPQELLFREEQAFHRNQKTADDAPGMAGSPETDGCVYRGNATAPDLRRPSNGLLHKSKRCMARAMAALPDSAPGFGERCRLLFCSAFLSNSRRSAYRLPPKNTGAAPPPIGGAGTAPVPCGNAQVRTRRDRRRFRRWLRHGSNASQNPRTPCRTRGTGHASVPR